MWMRMIAYWSVVVLASGAALGEEKYTIHENVKEGEVGRFSLDADTKTDVTTASGGDKTVNKTETGQIWKVTMTSLEVKDGSATKGKIEIDADGVDVVKHNGEIQTKSSCPFAGKSITVTRHPDESITNDFQGDSPDDDENLLNGFLTPDEDMYPDQPVAVGETWDSSDKQKKHASLGPNDQMMAECRLDWVKMVDGKQMAQITNSTAIIYHESGNVEMDYGVTSTLLVDLARGMIVKCDQKGSSKYKTAPKEATQMSGGMEFSFHAEELPVKAGAATKP